VQSALDVVVGGKHRPLLTPIMMSLILRRDQGQHEHEMMMERDAWAYRGGRE
jgi:hypothetical protein